MALQPGDRLIVSHADERVLPVADPLVREMSTTQNAFLNRASLRRGSDDPRSERLRSGVSAAVAGAELLLCRATLERELLARLEQRL
jgi:hypothetical protein